jgi:hypothetical protein
MKFRVVGSSKETGARMTLEFEALSKAQAERKAQQAGMAVNRVEIFSDIGEDEAGVDRRGVGKGRLIGIVLVLVIAGAVYFWLRGRGIVH